MSRGRRLAIVMLLGILIAVATAPAIGQVLPEGFTSRTVADQGGGLTGYDAAGNLYLYRSAWVASSGQATLERISPNGDRTALSVPLQYGQDMAVAPDGTLFVVGWDPNNATLVRRDTNGALSTLTTAGANEYFQHVALTSAGALVLDRQKYDYNAGWQTSLAVLSADGTEIRSITTPFQWVSALRPDPDGNVLVLGQDAQWRSALVRVNPETGATAVVAPALSTTSTTWAADVGVDPAGKIVASITEWGRLGLRTAAGALSSVPSNGYPDRVVSNESGSALFTTTWTDTGQKIQRVAEDGSLTTVFTSPFNTYIMGLAVDSSGTPYGIRHSNGTYDIVRIAGGEATPIAGSQTGTYIIHNSLAVDAAGNVIFSRQDGIFRLTPDGTLTKLADPYGGGYNNRVRIHPSTGQVYVADYGSGLAILEADGTFAQVPLTGLHGEILDFTFDRDGNLILSVWDRSGTVQGYRLYQVSAQGGTPTRYDIGVSGHFWFVPAFAANGTLWFPTAETSIQQVNADGSITPVITGLLGFTEFQLTFAPDGTLLLSSRWGGAADALSISGFSGAVSSPTRTRTAPALPAWAFVLLATVLARTIRRRAMSQPTSRFRVAL